MAIDRCPSFDDQAAYAAMDFLLASLPEIAEWIFSTTANLLNLSCDIIFVDTSSTYFEVDVADGEADLDLAEGMMESSAPENGSDASGPVERATASSTSIPRTTGPPFPGGHLFGCSMGDRQTA